MTTPPFHSERGFSMLEVVMLSALIMIAIFGAISAFELSNSTSSHTKLIGQQNDLRDFLVQNIDCKNTYTTAGATCTGAASLTAIQGLNSKGTVLVATPYTTFGLNEVSVLCQSGGSRLTFQVNSPMANGNLSGFKPLFWVPMECP